jgi:two-component system OmpR family response regulator
MLILARPQTEVRPRILVVDPDPNVVDLLSASLTFQGFEVYTAANGAAALDQAGKVRPDVVVLDVTLPGIDGFGVLTRLRAEHINAPVLFLTARDTLHDKVSGLTLGADDYITKPFSLEEVVTRLRVVLRRRTCGNVNEFRTGRLNFADIELNEDTHEVTKALTPVSMSPKEFALLRYFVINAGTVLSKQRILSHVWHSEFGHNTAAVETYVCYLRRKIDTYGDKRLIHTLRGVGYILREPLPQPMINLRRRSSSSPPQERSLGELHTRGAARPL